MRVSAVVLLLACISYVYAQCTPNNLPGNSDAAVIDADAGTITLTIRKSSAAQIVTLYETSSPGGSVGAQACFSYSQTPGSYPGYTVLANFVSGGCTHQRYAISLATYLSSTINPTGVGCGLSHVGGSIVTNIGHFGFSYDTLDATSGITIKTAGDYITLNLNTPTSVTLNPTAITVTAPLVFPPSLFKPTLLFVRNGASSSGTLKISWSAYTNDPYTTLAYNGNPITPFGGVTNTPLETIVQGSRAGTTTQWSSSYIITTPNFCSNLTSPAGTYTLKFIVRCRSAACRENIEVDVSFTVPAANLCLTKIVDASSIKANFLGIYDVEGGNHVLMNIPSASLKLDNRYSFEVNISTPFTLSAITAIDVRFVSTDATSTTLDMITDATARTNVQYSAVSDPSNELWTFYFTPSSGPAATNFFSSSSIGNNKALTGLTRPFTVQVTLSLTYANAQLNRRMLLQVPVETAQSTSRSLTQKIQVLSTSTRDAASVSSNTVASVVIIALALILAL